MREGEIGALQVKTPAQLGTAFDAASAPHPQPLFQISGDGSDQEDGYLHSKSAAGAALHR